MDKFSALLPSMQVRILYLALALLLTGCASTETPARFSFAATPFGLLRLDGKTGETAAMHNGTWVPIAETPATLDQILRDGSRRH